MNSSLSLSLSLSCCCTLVISIRFSKTPPLLHRSLPIRSPYSILAAPTPLRALACFALPFTLFALCKCRGFLSNRVSLSVCVCMCVCLAWHPTHTHKHTHTHSHSVYSVCVYIRLDIYYGAFVADFSVYIGNTYSASVRVCDRVSVSVCVCVCAFVYACVRVSKHAVHCFWQREIQVLC